MQSPRVVMSPERGPGSPPVSRFSDLKKEIPRAPVPSALAAGEDEGLDGCFVVHDAAPCCFVILTIRFFFASGASRSPRRAVVLSSAWRIGSYEVFIIFHGTRR